MLAKKKKISFISFPTINYYSKIDTRYKTDNLPDTIEICVNLNGCAFRPNCILTIDERREAFRLKISKDWRQLGNLIYREE